MADFLEEGYESGWEEIEPNAATIVGNASKEAAKEAMLSIQSKFHEAKLAVDSAREENFGRYLEALKKARDEIKEVVKELRAELKEVKAEMQQTLAQNQAILAMMAQQSGKSQEITIKYPPLPPVEKSRKVIKEVTEIEGGYRLEEIST